MSFGTRLKERRESVGLTQKELGEILGVSGNAVGNYENGVSSPNADSLYKVFDVLQCDANYLFQDEEKQPAENGELSKETSDFIEVFRKVPVDDRDLASDLVEAVLTVLIKHGRVQTETQASVPAESSH